MIKNYFIVAIRTFRRNKIFSGINILGLAIGLAAFWLIALYVGNELSYDNYHANANRIFRVAQHLTWEGGKLNLAPTPPPFAPALKADYPEIQETVRFDAEGGGIISYGNKQFQADDILFTDNTVFKVFSYHFLYGDAGTALSKPQSIVLTKTLAQKLFGDVDSAVNKTISFGSAYSNLVTGVIDDVPVNSHFTFSALRSLPDGFTGNWDNSYLYTYILLKENADVKKLEPKLPQFFDKYLKATMGKGDYRMELQPLKSIHLHSNLDYEMSSNGNINYVYILSFIAVLILVIASINYINLSTARASLRIKEVGVRKVNGSGKGQLILMFLIESVLITFIAAFIAIVLVYFSLPGFQQLTGTSLTLWRFGIVTTSLMLAGFSLLAGLVSGIYPALFISRFNPIPALKGQTGNQSGNLLFRKSLVVFQFVITIGMITGSMIIYQQLHYVLKKDLGFNKDQVITFHLSNQETRKKIPALKNLLLQNPLIEMVATAGNPIGNNNIGARDYKIEAGGSIDPKPRLAKQFTIDEDFVPTLQIGLVKGRNFLVDMKTDKDKVLLVNETLVKDAGWKSPIGKKIEFGKDSTGNPVSFTIAGVVKDFNIYSLQHKIEPLILQLPGEVNDKDNLYVRLSKKNIPAAIKFVEETYKKFDQGGTIDYHFLDQNFAQQYKAEQKQGTILLVFTIFAIFIACLGLFGLITFMAEQRIKEIGIRKVLGASVAGIVALLSKDFLKLVLIALLIAIPIAWYEMNKWLENFAYRINLSGWVFITAGVIALLIAFITISYQAIKAAIANPVKSLRTE
ncbi:MAG: ABC transporter permease [Ferruginibacter sp.]